VIGMMNVPRKSVGYRKIANKDLTFYLGNKYRSNTVTCV
jgi:hypothetical protein